MEKIYSPVENPGIIDLMIAPQPNHLAHQVAGIAADLRSNAPGSGPRAMLIALINTCLLRLFTRLETLLTLWQAGQLPQPTPRAVTKPQSAKPQPPHAIRAPRATIHRAHRRQVQLPPPAKSPAVTSPSAQTRPATAPRAKSSPHQSVATTERASPRCRKSHQRIRRRSAT